MSTGQTVWGRLSCHVLMRLELFQRQLEHPDCCFKCNPVLYLLGYAMPLSLPVEAPEAQPQMLTAPGLRINTQLMPSPSPAPRATTPDFIATTEGRPSPLLDPLAPSGNHPPVCILELDCFAPPLEARLSRLLEHRVSRGERAASAPLTTASGLAEPKLMPMQMRGPRLMQSATWLMTSRDCAYRDVEGGGSMRVSESDGMT